MHPSRTRWIFLAAVVVHLITAWFSTGYYAADEHYQIIEFAQARMGEFPKDQLAWEYADRLRSGLLPTLCVAVFKTAGAAGASSPFLLAFLLRALTAIVAMAIVKRFVGSAWHLVKEPLRPAFLFLSFFIWFLPFQHVRFSSETWAGLLLLLGIAELLRSPQGRWSWTVAGLCLGLSIFIKPVMLLVCAFAMISFLPARGGRTAAAARLAVGVVLATIIGLAADSWFYQEFNWSFWNYLHLNTLSILRIRPLPNVVEIFPWWYYFAWTAKYASWPIGAAILAALAWSTIKRPRSFIVWCIWPYLFLLMVIPHKELRFLFPLVDLVPLLLVLAWQDLQVIARPSWRPVLRGSVMLILTVNCLALAVVATSPAGAGRTTLAKHIEENYPGRSVRINYLADETNIWDIRIPPFYLSGTATDSVITDPCPLLSVHGTGVDLLVAGPGLKHCGKAGTPEWQLKMTTLPWWKEQALRWYEWENAKPVWILYEARMPTTTSFLDRTVDGR